MYTVYRHDFFCVGGKGKRGIFLLGSILKLTENVWFQITSALAIVRHHLRGVGGGQLRRHGMLDHHPVHDADLRHHLHRLLPLEDEQGPGLYHVPPLLRLRGRVAHVRVREAGVPRIKEEERESKSFGRKGDEVTSGSF